MREADEKTNDSTTIAINEIWFNIWAVYLEISAARI